MDQAIPNVYKFGPFSLDAQRRVLTRANERLEVSVKALEVLLVLVEKSGIVVTKDELLAAVWGDSHVEENNLTQSIYSLRKILGESAGENRYIATVPGQGYRFVADVRTVSGSADNVFRRSARVAKTMLTERKRMAALLAVGLVAGAIALLHYARHDSCRPPLSLDYLQGRLGVEGRDYLNALYFLQKAAGEEPRNPYVHAELSDAWSGVGHDQKAREEAGEARALSGRCSAEARLAFEARYDEAADDWQAAIGLYKGLWEGAKDNTEYALRFANALTEAGRGQEALDVLRELRSSSASAAYNPSVDLAEADVAMFLNNFQQERETAERAIRKAEDSQAPVARLLIPEAELHVGWALASLSQPARAQEAFVAARQAFANAGNQGGVADATNGIADLLLGAGDLGGAKKQYQDALAACQATLYERCAAENLCSLGDVLEQEGNLAEAERNYRECEKKSRSVADKTGVVTARLYLADLMADRNQFREAEAAVRKLLAEFAGQDTGVGVVNFYDILSRALLAEGKVTEAQETVERAAALPPQHKDRCVTISLAITAARLRARAGSENEAVNAISTLGRLASDANKASCYPLALKARLAQAETEAQVGRLTLGRDHLETLARDSAAKGFKLVASQAAQARER